jgi:hypothetical protein
MRACIVAADCTCHRRTGAFLESQVGEVQAVACYCEDQYKQMPAELSHRRQGRFLEAYNVAQQQPRRSQDDTWRDLHHEDLPLT